MFVPLSWHLSIDYMRPVFYDTYDVIICVHYFWHVSRNYMYPVPMTHSIIMCPVVFDTYYNILWYLLQFLSYAFQKAYCSFCMKTWQDARFWWTSQGHFMSFSAELMFCRQKINCITQTIFFCNFCYIFGTRDDFTTWKMFLGDAPMICSQFF